MDAPSLSKEGRRASQSKPKVRRAEVTEEVYQQMLKVMIAHTDCSQACIFLIIKRPAKEETSKSTKAEAD